MKKYYQAASWHISCFLFLSLFLFLRPGTGLAENQTIFLSPGWNLISLQVEPYHNAPNEVVDDLISTGKFLAIWSYNPATGAWSTYQQGESSLINEFSSLALTGIHAHQGYWIELNDYAELIIEGEISSSTLEFLSGWNLLGFSGYFLQATDEQDISSVFQDNLNKIDEIWKFDPTSGQFLAYDLTTQPNRIDFTKLEPGNGYWVKAKEPFIMAAQAGLTLEGDIDTPPLSTGSRPFPQLEDEDLNGDGDYDTPETQDTISFRSSLTVSYLTFTNRGLGTLNWEIREDLPWLFLDQSCGITTTETDSVCATVSREGLIPGMYTGTLQFMANGQSLTIQVKMIVPEIDGDYSGRAVVNYVNGEPADIASVDLSLSLFRDQEGFLRGIIDADKTLLFPFDVSLSGCYYETGTNRFVISGSFILHPGTDINNPPFDIFPGDNDIDLNGNGMEDIINPFPYDITREITLIGDRLKGDVLEGYYFEVLSGALPDPIMMEGTFSFGRESFTPTKKTPFNYNYTTVMDFPEYETIESPVFVDDPVLIDSVEVYLKLDHDSLADLKISLISPSGKEVILHNRTTGENIDTTYSSIYSSSPSQISKSLPAESLNAFKGEMGQGQWTLRIQNAGAYSGDLIEWNLHLYGTAIYKISGKVIDSSTGQEISGAHLTLTGAPVIHSARTLADGSYSFSFLTIGHYLLTVAKPGYATMSQLIWLEQGDMVMPDIALTADPVDEAILKAFPAVGTSPQEVNLLAKLPSGLVQAGDICTWSFGDGKSDSKAITSGLAHPEIIEIKHTYTSPGTYTASLRITDASGTQERILLSNGDGILIYPASGGANTWPYIFQWTFSGGGTEANEAAADTASFDRDRPPYRTVTKFPGTEDTDYSDNPLIPPNGRYDVYTPDPQKGPTRFRLITNTGAQMSGTCVGMDKKLQVGPAGLLKD